MINEIIEGDASNSDQCRKGFTGECPLGQILQDEEGAWNRVAAQEKPKQEVGMKEHDIFDEL